MKNYYSSNLDKRIEKAENLNYYFLAGYDSKQCGLFKRAIENFEKGKEIYEKGEPYKEMCEKKLDIIRQIVYPKKFLTHKKMIEKEEINGRSLKTPRKMISELKSHLSDPQFQDYLIKISN